MISRNESPHWTRRFTRAVLLSTARNFSKSAKNVSSGYWKLTAKRREVHTERAWI